ncbi:MAG: TetR/AcrR family transcriptional regulator [Sandaracinaceae bacterium]|nr:TetR/AcrR family transcriptional regulator [Sandaracinaceae bacterium]
MKSSPPKTPRRVPNQERARVLVAAILEASAHVLEVHGFEGATTARIAAKAGVSVGSLYQYFGTKEALFDALTAELIERLMLAVAPVVAAPAGTVEDRIERALDAGFRVIAPYPTVLRQLAAATDTAFEARLSVLRLQAIDLVGTLLSDSTSTLDSDEIEVRARVVVNASEGIVLNLTRGDDSARIAREASRMFARYCAA